MYTNVVHVDPIYHTEAVKHSHWQSAMSDEFLALIRNGTWELIPPHKALNIIGCKWVFKTKLKVDGTVEQHKARLIAKGFHKRPEMDFTETFSPVIKPVTIRLLLSLAVSTSWFISHSDVSNAFLHSDLDTLVYLV